MGVNREIQPRTVLFAPCMKLFSFKLWSQFDMDLSEILVDADGLYQLEVVVLLAKSNMPGN